MNTRKYPRTLDEAFGPYGRGDVVEMQSPEPLGHKVARWLSTLLAVVLVGLVAVGVV